MFIKEPFIQCPFCHKKEEFGVVSIYSASYSRRCKSCLKSQTYSLPLLNKKIIYLDQFAISNMMKSINPKLKKVVVDPFFKILFEKVDRLSKLQLIICPDSNTQYSESLVSPYFKPLKRMYEQLSHGTSFHFPETIKRFQIHNNFKKWLGQKNVKDITLHDIVQGQINEWQDRLLITINSKLDSDIKFIEDIRKDRNTSSLVLNEVFKEWQKQKRKKFNDWFEEEISDFGPSIWKKYLMDLQKLSNPTSQNLIASATSFASVTISSLLQELDEIDLDETGKFLKIKEYLYSDSIKKVHYVTISGMLFASLAREAANGRQKFPTKGMMNDIETISSYLPYCDAIFLDKECHNYLIQEPLKKQLKYGNKVFSLNNKKDFLMYLDNIEKSASKSHLDKVKEVYGDSWISPYLEMFK